MALRLAAATTALFVRLSNVDGIQFATRELADWSQTAPAKEPALMLTSGPIAPFVPNGALQGNAPPMWKVSVLAILYVQVPNGKTETPDEILNPLIEAVCNALLKTQGEAAATGAQFPANLPGQRCTTLGGLAAACYVSGSIDRAEGIAGRIAVATIPIEMVLTS